MTSSLTITTRRDLTVRLAGTQSVVAVGLLFAVNGLIIGGYGGVLPSIRERLAINATHNRAVFTYTDTTGAAHMAVIDTATATQTGQTINLPGQSTNNLILTNDGTQAAIITTANNKGTITTTITTINLGNDGALEI